MEIASLVSIIKWVILWAGVTFFLGTILYLYLKNAEMVAKSSENQKSENQMPENQTSEKPENKETTEVLESTEDITNSVTENRESGGEKDENG